MENTLNHTEPPAMRAEPLQARNDGELRQNLPGIPFMKQASYVIHTSEISSDGGNEGEEEKLENQLPLCSIKIQTDNQEAASDAGESDESSEGSEVSFLMDSKEENKNDMTLKVLWSLKLERKYCVVITNSVFMKCGYEVVIEREKLPPVSKKWH